MAHLRTRLKKTIDIKQMITMYYFEFGKEYVFRGEKHDFWEFLYVDKGEIEVIADDRQLHLEQGSIVFHKPNEFHRFHANRVKAPNLIVMTFDCDSPAMKHFHNAVIRLEADERNLLASVIEEGMHAFSFPFRYPLRDHRLTSGPVGCEQMIKLYLEMFLIRLLRRISARATSGLLPSTVKEKNDEAVVKSVVRYLEERVGSPVTLDDISDTLHVSKSRLKELFKKGTGLTIMEYFAKLRIDKAKLLIREQPNNFTEIAGMTGFGSVHYFSKAFKKATGMNPSEYARSVKGRLKSQG